MAHDTHPVEHHDHAPAEHGGHASLKTYIMIGVILTVITAVEVAIFYLPAFAAFLIPTLIILSLAKFMLVVLFFMHLRYDSKIFGRVFFGPLMLAVLVVVSLIVLFWIMPEYTV